MEAKLEDNNISEEMVLRRHFSIDQHLKDIYGFLMSVYARAATNEDPECTEIRNYFEQITPVMLRRVKEYEDFAASGDTNFMIDAAEALCSLGDAYLHNYRKARSAFECYTRSIDYLTKIIEKRPDRLSGVYYILCKAIYGIAFIRTFIISEDKNVILKKIDSHLRNAMFKDTYGISYRKLCILKAVISDEPKAEEELIFQLNHINEIISNTDEHNFLDFIIIGKAYQKVALYCMQEARGIKSARNYIVKGYSIIPSNWIRDIYARDLWRFCPNHNEADLLGGMNYGYKNEVFDSNNSGDVYANYYLAIIYFALGVDNKYPDIGYIRRAYNHASYVLKNSTEKIKNYEKMARYLDDTWKKHEKGTLFPGLTTEETESYKNLRSKFTRAFEAYDFMRTVMNQAALHCFVMIECLKNGSSYYFDIPLEDIGEDVLKFRILKGAAFFHEGSKTNDKNKFKKAYEYLSELLKMRFYRNDMEKFHEYEQVLIGEGYIALAELVGNKKCGIGNDTEKAKAILDDINDFFTFPESRDYFSQYYSKIKKSLFGGYRFKWIVK